MTRAANAFEILAALGPIGHANVTDFQNAVQFISTNTEGLSMPSLKELREKRGELNKQFQAIVNRVESENRDITPEENFTLNEINADDSALVTEIRKEEAKSRSEELSRAIEIEGQRRGIVSSGEHAGYAATDIDKAVAAFARNAHGRPVPADEWEAALRIGNQPGGSGLDILMNHLRPGVGRNQAFFGPQNGMVTWRASKGGTLALGAGFGGAFEWALKSNGTMLEIGDVWISEDGVERPWPTLNDTDEIGTLIGEGHEAPEGDISAGAIRFGSHKITSKIIRVSQELIDDSPANLASELGNAAGSRIGRGVNYWLTMGDTPNAPRGIVPSSPIGKVTASSTIIAGDELIDLAASVDPIYQGSPNSAFMMSPAVFAMLQKLKDAEGRYLLGDFENGATPKLRGWPVRLNPSMPSTLEAGAKVILFGDLSKYKVRIVRQIRLRTLTELYAKSDEIGILAFLRFDGHLMDAGTHPVQALQMKP